MNTKSDILRVLGVLSQRYGGFPIHSFVTVAVSLATPNQPQLHPIGDASLLAGLVKFRRMSIEEGTRLLNLSNGQPVTTFKVTGEF